MCPPETEQMCWSPPYWQILAPRLKQCQKLLPDHEHGMYNLEELLFAQEKSWGAWSKLAKPVEAGFFVQGFPTRKHAYQPNRQAASVSRLEGMPAELLKMIFYDETLEQRDIVALGLCSQILWQHMLQRVESAYRNSAAPWAGVEIACTGTYLTGIPNLFHTADVEIELFTYEHEPDQRMLPKQFNWSTWSEFTTPEENQQNAWRTALRIHRQCAAISDSHWPRLEQDILCTNLFPPLLPKRSSQRHSWILRNQTTKEYVRLRASANERTGYVVPGVPWLRLDDVLLMRICWASTLTFPLGLDLGTNQQRGKWAGHCFEVVVEEVTSGEARVGKDITGEIACEAWRLRRLFDSHRRVLP